MAPKTKKEKPAGKGPVYIGPRSRDGWNAILEKAAAEHWRTLRVEIQVRERLLGGVPARLDGAMAMIKARGLEDVLDARQELIVDPTEREKLAEQVQDEGLCQFARREGKPGLWLPSNNIKAGLKENWQRLGYRKEVMGSRGAMAEGMFVRSTDPSDPDWIYLGEAPDGIATSVTHPNTPQGPITSIKRNEYLSGPRIAFHILIAHAVVDYFEDEHLAKTMVHFCQHGLGASRSQGHLATARRQTDAIPASATDRTSALRSDVPGQTRPPVPMQADSSPTVATDRAASSPNRKGNAPAVVLARSLTFVHVL